MAAADAGGGVRDPCEILRTSRMSAIQIAAVAITIGLNALDGFDVLAISFASPGIAHEWRIDRAALGIVLSMELIGMGAGSMLLGRLADRIGRRRTLLSCLVVMTIGMIMATRATQVYELSLWRVFTGLGIGGMLAGTNALAAELSNERRRALNVSLMASGYPVGAVLGGSIAAVLLRRGDWRVVFEFGAAATAIFIPLVWYLVPESVVWLCQKQPPGALNSVNRSLVRMGHAPVPALPALKIAGPGSMSAIFSSSLIRTTLSATPAYFFHVTTFYFLLKWVPKIVSDMGYPDSAAAGVLVWANVGGVLGGVLLGLLSLRFGLKPLTIAVLLLSTFLVSWFGHGQPDLFRLSVICALTHSCTNAGIVGLYGLLAQAYPAQARASGTGFVIGIGRAGAVLSPILAGYLFRDGYGLQFVALIMSVGSMVGAVALAFLPLTISAGGGGRSPEEPSFT